ncbi:hypothetical protein A3D45_02305 [Candidatus Falkowbacteria bacterium RIFCSPHIGHO2_02_FULL_42_9]|uniref:EF-hand domain-containing protein n=1 Tax=Candidatus Falkowbacteria bacterium RIFCSPHIGHO2_02_FULL_42_9 TaxID=1797986 RepID=A0A1F5S937_9BACT|nr:MAG: hypothetical protein A3D45_02305 [Candidatus Falkowbacteria bacterium RIFCSPHIGHO2_02_FULL_42_9]
MFNPLNFFKKKLAESPDSLNKPAEPVVEKQVQIDDIAIHTMPERFRHQPKKADSAKITGLLIIGGGVVILILVSTGLYFYLFKTPTVTVKEEPSTATVTPASENQVQSEIDQNTASLGTLTATTTEPTVLPTDDDLAAGTASSAPETIEQELTVGLTPGLDSDNDGLTDAAEIILSASTSIPDTDGDGYLDGAELLNLYDPAGLGRLATNPNIALYDNKTFNYTALYPSAWQISVNGGDDSIMFKAAGNQLLQIIVQANTSQQSLDQWYMDQLGAITINEPDRVFGANWQGIKSLDGLTLYLMDPNQKYIFTLAYNPGENNILEYINIFNMMIKSFSLKE